MADQCITCTGLTGFIVIVYTQKNLRYEVKKALASATWLVKQSGQYDPTTHDPNNSAMALEPNTPGKIQI